MERHIYFIGAHPDDLIGSAGAALLFQAKGGYRLHIVDYTRGERGLVSQGVSMEECSSTRVAEEEKVAGMLGAELHFMPEIDGEAYAGKETVQLLAELFRRMPPAAIFLHWPVDSHPDHIMCYAGTMAAMRDAAASAEILFFEESVQTRSMPVAYYLPLPAEIMEKKLVICRAYACQNGEDDLASRKLCEAQYNGWKAGSQYAECYGSYQLPLPGSASILNDIMET